MRLASLIAASQWTVIIRATECVEWEAAFEAKENGFDLHHYLKATAAAEGICIQIVKESGALEYYCRCSVAWRLSIAMYTKAGGVPWVLGDSADGTAYVGISYPALQLHFRCPVTRCRTQHLGCASKGEHL
jgi:hypothetical protein